MKSPKCTELLLGVKCFMHRESFHPESTRVRSLNPPCLCAPSVCVSGGGGTLNLHPPSPTVSPSPLPALFLSLALVTKHTMFSLFLTYSLPLSLNREFPEAEICSLCAHSLEQCLVNSSDQTHLSKGMHRSFFFR